MVVYVYPKYFGPGAFWGHSISHEECLTAFITVYCGMGVVERQEYVLDRS